MAEKHLVRIDTADGILFFDFRDHFVRAAQLLSPAWGYHGSFAGAGDDMAFQIGPVHAVGLIAALVLVAVGSPRGVPRRLAIGALAGSVLGLIGMLEISRPVWEILPPLRYLQFPWRLLAPMALLTAILLAVVAAQWEEVARRRSAGEDFLLLDVREHWEIELANLGTEKVAVAPLSQLAAERLAALPEAARDPNTPIVVLCHHGVRSADVTAWLLSQGWTNVVSMRGGIAAYAEQVDPSVGTY